MSSDAAEDEVSAGPTGSFASLSIPAFRLLWIGSIFSYMSVQMQFLLRGLLAWDLTEREGALGIVYLAFGFAMLIATPLGGVASDRMRKRTLLLFGQAVLTLVAVFMGVVVLLDVVEFWMLPLSSLVQGIMFGLTGPARVTFAAQLVGRERIGNAVSLSMLGMNSSRVVAPSFAGALAGVALIGIGGAYLVGALFAVCSFVLVLRLPDPDPTGNSRKNPFQDIAEGVRYVASVPSLRRLLLTMFVVVMVAFNYVSFMPALVEGEFGKDDTWVGYMSSASSIGAVAAAIPIAGIADSPKARRWFILCGFGFGATVALLGVAPNLGVAMFVTVLIGAAATGFQSLAGGIALGDSLETHHGRVQSLMQLSFAAFGMAAAPLGLLAEAFGLRPVLFLMGIIALAAMTLTGFFEWSANRRSAEDHLATALFSPGEPLAAQGPRNPTTSRLG
ncbi:MAG: MFS transporter [Actinomycetia bacterium]|nr:MFS transporter [Actinomycetes bacterium]MCP4958265.1 MFS transporter [Actinomycetes bacterium]